MDDQQQDELKRRVRAGYSRQWVVSKYSVLGLWPSESDLCTRYWSDHSRILDIGCGAGRTSLPLAQMGYRVTAFDLAPPMVKMSARFADRLRTPVDFATADATRLPFRSDAFDGVLFSYNGLELVPGRNGKLAVMQECYRVLAPGGTFIFTTHAFEALNRYALHRVGRLILHEARRLCGLPTAVTEFGEIIPDPERNVEVYYMQINSPRMYRRSLRRTGFEIAYSNSRQRVDSGKPPRFWSDFDGDFKFYVARKPCD